jgi:hypothetical protein
VVRATATGVVTATIRCPWPDAQIAPQGMTAAGHRAFFVVCQKTARHGKGFVVTGARIYQFRLSGSGGISGYSLVPGGVLGQHRVEDVAASLDGAQLAVTVGPASLSATSPEQADVLVINSQTGVRAIWHGGVKVFGAADLTFTSGGRELQFLGRTRCGQATGTTKARGAATCRELRAVSPAAAGGELDSSRLLLRLSALIRSPADYVNDVVISPDGSTLTAAVIHSRSRPHQSTSILIIKYSAATGRQLHVLYRMRTGNGFFYRFFGSDPTGRYLLFNAGPTSGTVNGWIDHGRLIRLKPADGSNVFYETW